MHRLQYSQCFQSKCFLLFYKRLLQPLSPLPLSMPNKCFIKLLYLYDHNNTGVKKGNSLLDFNCISYLFPSSLLEEQVLQNGYENIECVISGENLHK